MTVSLLASCGDDDIDYDRKEKQENLVEYKVSCNNPIAHIDIWQGSNSHIAIGTWETSFITKGYTTELSVTCQEDKKATITIQLYVNNKFVQEVSGYTPVKLHYNLK
jgi:hypothetical protein